MRRRWNPGLVWTFGIVGVLVAAAAGTAVGMRAGEPDGGGDPTEPAKPSPAAKVAAADIDDVSIDPGVADTDLSIGGDDVDVIVHNDFGRDIPEVLLELTIDEPGGDFPKVGVAGGDEFCEDGARGNGVSKADGEAECERLRKSGKEWCRPDIEPLEPGTQESKCFRTLHPGENRYLYDMGLWPELDEGEQDRLRGYPRLTVTVELSVDGEVFADAEALIPSPSGP